MGMVIKPLEVWRVEINSASVEGEHTPKNMGLINRDAIEEV
jgi:hypothetical protein